MTWQFDASSGLGSGFIHTRSFGCRDTPLRKAALVEILPCTLYYYYLVPKSTETFNLKLQRQRSDCTVQSILYGGFPLGISSETDLVAWLDSLMI